MFRHKRILNRLSLYTIIFRFTIRPKFKYHKSILNKHQTVKLVASFPLSLGDLSIVFINLYKNNT